MNRRTFILSMWPVAVAGACVGPVQAHHSFAMFDKSRLVTVKGTLTKLEWTNPHVYLFVSGTGEDGKAREYMVEAGSINMLSRKGWKVNTVKVGEALSIAFFPLRDGHPGGLLDSVTLSNGTVMKE